MTTVKDLVWDHLEHTFERSSAAASSRWTTPPWPGRTSPIAEGPSGRSPWGAASSASSPTISTTRGRSVISAHCRGVTRLIRY